MKKLGLKTFEDIYSLFKEKFKEEIEDITVLDDFIIGNEYTSYDVAIFSRTYNFQSGIYLIGDEPNYQAIFIKATLKNGNYPNEWIVKDEELKYYFYAPNGKYDQNYKYNRAIINSKNIPIYVFIKTDKVCKLVGIFKYIEYVTEENGLKWFRLRKIDSMDINKTITQTEYQNELDKKVKKSMNSSKEERRRRLKQASRKATKVETIVTNFKRNSDVIAEVLERANGICEKCNKPAPFIRVSDGTPYLEVHHKVPLAEGGDDTVENAIAVCPNCHRELHFGIK